MIQVTIKFKNGAVAVTRYPVELLDNLIVETPSNTFSAIEAEPSTSILFEPNRVQKAIKQDFQLDEWKLNDGTKVNLMVFQGGRYEGIFVNSGASVIFDSHGYITSTITDHRYLKTSRNHQEDW